MIVSGIHGRWATNCRHPRIVSDVKNRTAPATAQVLPAAAAAVTINEITPRYDVTGIRSAGRPAIAGREDAMAERDPERNQRDPRAREVPPVPLVGDHEPDHVREVPGQERGQPGHEPVVVAEQEHVAGQAQHERDDEPRPHLGIGRVEGDRGADQRHERERLAPHLGRAVVRPPAPPVGDGERCRGDEPHSGRRGHIDIVAPRSDRLCDRVQRSVRGSTVPRRVASRAGRGAPAFPAPT